MQQESIQLLRKPCPPSEKYSKLFQDVNKKITPTSSTESKSTCGRSTHNSCHHEDHYVPLNTPTKQQKYPNMELIKIHPLYPKGPHPLPPSRIMCQIDNDPLLHHDDIHNNDKPEFTFNDFLMTSHDDHTPIITTTNKPFISHHNYLKLTSWFATQKPKQDKILSWQPQVEMCAPEQRKPKHQIMIEFQAMLNEMLLESQSEIDNISSMEMIEWPHQHQHDTLIQSSRSRFFCGEGRSQSPFNSSHHSLINPPEVAVLQSMMNGGTHLSLKAHFLSQLPNLISLSHTLTHLNLSFNTFKTFPSQILELTQLISLKMRNNPIRELPSDISKLHKLEIMSLPFNLLSDLPQGLFEMDNLIELDLSHNSIQWLSRDIDNLRNLRHLNIECNQLSGLPATILSLSLSHLHVDNNYFHPALWTENTLNQPQTLIEMCCHNSVHIYNVLSQTMKDIVDSNRSGLYCDMCHKQIYGTGLRVIRSVGGVTRVFGVKLLPLILIVCSIKCQRVLKDTRQEIKWDHYNKHITCDTL